MSNQPIYRIYSRKRLKFGLFGKYGKKYKKILPLILSICIGVIVCYVIWNSVDPIFIALCKDEAKSIATKITNEETSKIMDKYNYETFFNIEKDNDGNIQMISANILKVNQITSEIATEIQNALEDSDNNKIYIAIGSATGIKMLSGVGPKIPVSISTSGTVETNLRSEFIAQSVNQTLHRVYLEIQANVAIVMSNSVIEESIDNQVLILENVIVGEIPSTYYNFDGVESESGALEIME